MEGIRRPPHPIVRGGRIARPDRVDAGPLSIKGPCQAAAVLSLPGSRRGGGIHFDIPPPQPPTRARPRPPPRGGEDPPPPGRYGCGLVAVSTASGPAWRGSTTSLACCCQAATPFPPQARRVGRRSPGGGGADVRQPPGPPPSPSPSHSPPMTATCSFFCSDPKPSSAAASQRVRQAPGAAVSATAGVDAGLDASAGSATQTGRAAAVSSRRLLFGAPARSRRRARRDPAVGPCAYTR